MPRPPIILTNVSVAESREEAQARATTYLARKWESIDTHYHFSDGHLAAVKGYGNENRALDFIAFVRSDTGRKILDKYGFRRP